MSNLFDYSTTPASNNSAAPNGAPEGMTPSSLNDAMRQMMANAAGAFTCYTAGGSANAQTVTMSPTLAAYSNKVRIAFIPVANNTGACTLNVNGLGAVSIKMLDGTDPPAGALNSSGVAVVQHNGTNFRLLNPANLVGVTATAAEVNVACGGSVAGSRVELGGDFTAGEDVICIRIGNTVTITSDGALSHASSSLPAASGTPIPSAYRPSTSIVFPTGIEQGAPSTYMDFVEIGSTGSFEARHHDWAGALVAKTVLLPFSISFIVTSAVP